MKLSYTYQTASKDGKAWRIPAVPKDVLPGVIQAYRDAGYNIATIEEVFAEGSDDE